MSYADQEAVMPNLLERHKKLVDALINFIDELREQRYDHRQSLNKVQRNGDGNSFMAGLYEGLLLSGDSVIENIEDILEKNK